jgi:uncharacterized protein YbaP (TraB family)
MKRRMNRLKRCIAAGLGALAFVTSVPAWAEPAPAAQAEARAPDGPALWKVADEDTTIYLFGTVHALPPGTIWMNQRIESALASSGEFVTEVDLADARQVKAGMLQLAFLPKGVTLRALLRDKERASFDQAMTGLGLSVEAFDRFKPWYAAMMLSLLPLAKNGFTADAGAETVLEAKLKPGSTRAALESVSYQLQLFDSLPAETQIAYLLEVSEGVPEMNDQLGKMIGQWLKGDADALARLLNEETSDSVLLEKLLLERNRNWAGWITERLKQPGTVFMAVGAGHLAGAGSVQDVLAHRGVASQRVH